jgi:uncharacterized protein
MSADVVSVLWRDRESGGLDRCVLSAGPDGGHRLSGTVLQAMDDVPYEVRYTVMTDASWTTRSVGVHVQGGSGDARLALLADGEGGWSAGREPLADLDGCLDVDLVVTPATNTLPIRRLDLAVGETADVAVAWVRFPELTVEVAEQRYERQAPDLYRYSAGRYAAELVVDDHGLVLDYEEAWHAIATA